MNWFFSAQRPHPRFWSASVSTGGLFPSNHNRWLLTLDSSTIIIFLLPRISSRTLEGYGAPAIKECIEGILPPQFHSCDFPKVTFIRTTPKRGKPVSSAFGEECANGGKSLHAQSHGESFLSPVLHRFSGSGLYLLDEPEAALSPSRQMPLITRIHDLIQKNSQFIIATHSPIIMAYPNSWIYMLNDNGIEKVS